MKVYLHVGMPKCASSTLQRFFRDNHEQHVKCGFCYPEAYREKGGYFSHRPLHKLSPEKIGFAIREIKNEAESKGCDKIFISSEEFTNSLWGNDVAVAIIRELNHLFGVGSVSVIMVVRNHLPFVESVFAQFVKGGMFRVHMGKFFQETDGDLLGFIDFFKKKNGFDFFVYSNFVDLYKSIAPRNRVTLVSMEREDNGGRDIVDVMCDWFSLPLPDKEGGKVNSRFSEKTLLAMRYARMHFGGEDFIDKRKKINKVFERRGDGRSKEFSLSGTAYGRVKEGALKDLEYFEKNAYDIPRKAFSDLDAFPRELDNISLSGEEMCAIKYLMEEEVPDIGRAHMLADFALPYIMDMVNRHERKLNQLDRGFLKKNQ
ncbi:radical SAM protein [Halomonas organivorans]|uniref:Sulfotransferase domain-containing protein n=1 Tax=Halomonas organivorans TaxID=257772 RepID=A0A7W5G7C4_9GAMM|nr:radical SAM protein [Halomonas organivorans]MBB3143493.1 hypothetical protein [Halomonas organivorans]